MNTILKLSLLGLVMTFISPVSVADDLDESLPQAVVISEIVSQLGLPNRLGSGEISSEVNCFSVYKQQDFANRVGLAAAYLLRPDVAKDVDVRWGIPIAEIPVDRIDEIMTSIDVELRSARKTVELAGESTSNLKLAKWYSHSPKVYAVSNHNNFEGYLIPRNVSIEKSEELFLEIKTALFDAEYGSPNDWKNLGIAFASQESIPKGIPATQIVNWDAFNLNSPNVKCANY